MVLFTKYNGEKLKRKLPADSNLACSDVPFKFKRPKVFAIRDFPDLFGQFASHTNRASGEALGSAPVQSSGRKFSADDGEDDVEPYEVDVLSDDDFEPYEFDIVSNNDGEGVDHEPYELDILSDDDKEVDGFEPCAVDVVSDYGKDGDDDEPYELDVLSDDGVEFYVVDVESDDDEEGDDDEPYELELVSDDEKLKPDFDFLQQEAVQLCVKLSEDLDDAEFKEEVESLEQENSYFIESKESAGHLELKNVFEDITQTWQVDKLYSLKKSNNTSPKISFPQRKVYAVRDFPEVFYQCTGLVNWTPKKASNFIGTNQNMLEMKDSADDSDDEFEQPFAMNVGFHENFIHAEVNNRSYDLESHWLEPGMPPGQEENLDHDVELFKALGNSEPVDPLKTSVHESTDVIRSAPMLNEDLLDIGAQPHQEDRPSSLTKGSNTIPKIRFEESRVSCIRYFPPGCGNNATHHSTEDGIKALASYYSRSLTDKKPIVEDEPFEEAVNW